jgi:ATP adenylyltransferase
MAKKKVKKELSEDFQWPLSRRILYRPDRYNYVRKVNPDKTCVFCRSRDLGIKFESLCVFKSKLSMIVMNKFPYNTGHLLVLPQSHKGDLLLLEKKEYQDLMACLKLAVEAIEHVYQPEGKNVGLNLGECSGAGIPQHLHFHVIPRWFGDLNFFPLISETKVLIEYPETSFERLRNYFSNLKVS